MTCLFFTKDTFGTYDPKSTLNSIGRVASLNLIELN